VIRRAVGALGAPAFVLMVLTLERRGLISRLPGEARSIRPLVPPENLPMLEDVPEA
jgi:hypothetical protein